MSGDTGVMLFAAMSPNPGPGQDPLPATPRSRTWLLATARTLAATGSRPLWRSVCLAIVLVVVVNALSWAGGAFSCELGSYDPDEPAHFTTGLLVHDYLGKGLPGPPMPFARNFYIHYPKVALGVWPPLFYIIEGIYFLFVPPSHASVLLLMALITVLAAVTLFQIALEPLGLGLALVASVVFAALPVVQTSSDSVFVDGLVAAIELLAVVQVAHYAETEKPKHIYWFGLLESLGALAKANAIALILVPPITLMLTAKGRLLRRKEVWLAMLIMLVMAAPWNYYVIRLAMNSVGLIRAESMFFLDNVRITARMILDGTGVFLPLAAVGFWDRIFRPLRSARVGAIWGASLALIVAVLLFHTALPSVGLAQRYFLPVFAALLLFAMAGVQYIARSVPIANLGVNARTGVLAGVVAAAFLCFQFRIVQKQRTGFEATADRIANELTPKVVLICGDPREEGMVVSEIAMRDLRPRHFVLRASKVLSESDWTGKAYTSLFSSAGRVATYLDFVPVDYVLIDDPDRHPEASHHELLAEALKSRPDVWHWSGSAGNSLQLWRRVHALSHGEPRISIGMKYTLQPSLSNGTEGSPAR